MPDHKQLRPGDKIRFIKVSDSDLATREREIKAGLPDAGWTADTLERIVGQKLILIIDHIDEYGIPWVHCRLMGVTKPELHSIAIMDDDTWEYVVDD